MKLCTFVQKFINLVGDDKTQLAARVQLSTVRFEFIIIINTYHTTKIIRYEGKYYDDSDI